MTLKKLIAFDIEDLAILSAHLQDAQVNVSDMIYLSAEHRFALVAQRFAREDGLGASDNTHTERRSVGMHFERVLGVKTKGFNLSKDDQLQLLAIVFLEGEAPSGIVKLTFAGGCEIRLEVECLEAMMSDLCQGETASCPQHS